MAINIVHISDIHFDERDARVAERLAEAVKSVNPAFLVCTGDLVSQPLPHNVKKAKSWLDELAKACNVPDNRVLIIPGNHDYGFWGSFGVSFLSGFFFRRAFKGKRKKRVLLFPEQKLIFLHIDSNPSVLDLARGKVSGWKIRKLIAELTAVPVKTRDDCTKIALIHHHCLPVYNEATGDRFLLLKNSQAVIEFFADYGVNLVLHGHKHRATHSFLSIGGVAVQNRAIEVLAAGTAIKRNDYEDRGHNFNLISIDQSGFRSVTQFFSKPVGSVFVPGERSYGFAREYFEQLYENNKSSQRYAVQRLHWDLNVTVEGDRFNEMIYTGFRAAHGTLDPPEFKPPTYTVERGSIPGAKIDEKRSSFGVTLEEAERTNPKELDFKIKFSEPPTREQAANFVIQSWDLNASALSEEEFRIKHPDATDFREYEEKEIDGAIENFTWQVSFPISLSVQNVRFEVFDQDGHEKQPKLTEILAANFLYSSATNNAFVNLYKPPAGYRYRISWKVPQGTPSLPVPVKAQIDFDTFKSTLLKFRSHNPQQPPDEMLKALAILVTFMKEVAERVATMNGVKSDSIKFETSFMVYDESSKPGKLRMIIGTLMATPKAWAFDLEIGDGNAGRAYKGNILRLWFKDQPSALPFQWYLPVIGFERHTFLCSVPLRHPACPHLIMGVLNLGSFDKTTSQACRCLDSEAESRWLIQAAHDFVLTRLCQEFIM